MCYCRVSLESRGCPMKCAHCDREISPEQTFQVYGSQVAHLDCRKPRDLNNEERALLFTYCFDHAVTTCPTCSQEFRQYELASDLLGNRTHLCPRCRMDLTERLREHLYGCTLLPAEVRRRAREARAAAQRLVKQSHELSDRADVLMREAEAALAALRDVMLMTWGGTSPNGGTF